MIPLVGRSTVDPGGKPSEAKVALEPDEMSPSDVEPAAVPLRGADNEAKLRVLKCLFEQELIMEEEYTANEAEILDRL